LNKLASLIFFEEADANQPLCHASAQNALEDVTECLALTEAPMAVLREGGVVGDFVFQAQLAKPSIGKIEMDLLAQPAL
jgi:hypothetical protein